MADGFQGGEEIYKGGRQEQDPKKLAEIVKKYRELIKVNRELDTISTKQSKSLAAQQKNLERLEKRLISLRKKAVDPVAKAMETLTTKFVGGSGVNQAITRFTGATANSVFQVDKVNDRVKIFGRTLDVSATAALRYTGAIQLIIAATLKYLEFQDKAQKRQGELMRAFADTNVSISQTYTRQATAWRIAGSEGAKAGQAIDDALARARLRGASEFLKPGTVSQTQMDVAKAQYNELIAMVTAYSKRVPEFVTRLSESFAMREQTSVVTEIEKLITLSTKAGMPLEQFADLVFSLGEKFTYLGMQAKDARAMIAEFADAVGKRGMPAAVGMAVAAQTAAEFQTAAGVPGVGKTAFMVAKQFQKLPASLQEMVGGKQFLGKSVYQQMEDLYKLSKEQYMTLKAAAGYYQVQELKTTRGVPAAMAAAPELTGLEWQTVLKYFEAATPGRVTKEESAKAMEDLYQQMERGKVTSADVKGSIDSEREALLQRLGTISETQVEWYGNIVGAVNDVKAAILALKTGEISTKQATKDIFDKTLGPAATTETKIASGLVGQAVLGPLAPMLMQAEFAREFIAKKSTPPQTVETEGNEVVTSDGKKIKVTNVITYTPETETPAGRVSHSQIYKPKE